MIQPLMIDFSIYDPQTRELLDDVYSVYGQFSAWKLRNMTHEEAPWKTFAPTNGVISHKAMREFFETQLVDEADL